MYLTLKFICYDIFKIINGKNKSRSCMFTCGIYFWVLSPASFSTGIPESWMQRLKLMITAEEAQNPENAEKAAQLCRWIDNRQGGNHSEEFMRVNSSPSNSCTNSSTISSDEGFQSHGGDDDNGGCADDSKHESLPLDDSYLNESHEGDSIVSVEGDDESVRGETDEVPTLRRKRGQRKGTKQGPRVTRNLSEEEVMAALQDCCIQFSPWEFYDKVIGNVTQKKVSGR